MRPVAAHPSVDPGRVKIEPNPTPVARDGIIDVGDLPDGIIDVGDLPDGIIDVGDLPDGFSGGRLDVHA